jgi:hypothetical protein
MWQDVSTSRRVFFRNFIRLIMPRIKTSILMIYCRICSFPAAVYSVHFHMVILWSIVQLNGHVQLNSCIVYYRSGIAQLAWRLATGWTVQGSNPFGERDSPHPFRPALGPTQPPIQWVPCLSRG